MNDSQLKERLNNIKEKEYIYVSLWFGGRKPGYDGYIISLDNNEIYKFESVSDINDINNSNAKIEMVASLSYPIKEKLLNYINDGKLFYFDKVDNPIFDRGTTIEIFPNNNKCIIKNADKISSNGIYNIYDELLEIIESSISNVDFNSIITTLLDYIEKQPDGYENSLLAVLNEVYTDLKYENGIYYFGNNELTFKNLFELQELLIKKSQEKNILLDFSKYDGQAVGLPFNIPFVKRSLNK